ncbi:MAG: 4-(cytidine 5'-diphospho)-2-C-methyl-D-erythritol kinase [candidate division Zixibacteria bacterium]|nr:4-(cytidine 5'-diphospho)-2-C-methyl-D-erythritol kinase [candidate division Zixibacteria bacterium]
MLIKQLSKDFIEIHAPAKINLFLQVLGKRPDGFHNINSLMQAITLFDRLKIEKIDEPECRVKLTGNLSSTAIENNLVTRAYELFKKEFGLKSGIKVDLEKNIPIAAGLGGGSSDCAAAMIAYNLIFDLKLSNSELVNFSLKLGSDIPFFFSRGQALVSGRGEIVEETSFPVDYNIIVVSTGIPVSTVQSYKALNLKLTTNKSTSTLEPNCGSDIYIELLSRLKNDLEAIQFEFTPGLLVIKEELLKSGALLARMSGSGPTMFGIFLDNCKRRRVSSVNFPDCHLYTVKPFLLTEREMQQQEGKSNGDYRDSGYT